MSEERDPTLPIDPPAEAPAEEAPAEEAPPVVPETHLAAVLGLLIGAFEHLIAIMPQTAGLTQTMMSARQRLEAHKQGEAGE